jgi:thymidylate synthase (FAD)
VKVHDRPLVVLVTRPSIVHLGVQVLLEEYGLNHSDWSRGEGDGDGDGIPELMGRLCYGSFGPRQGRVGATDYLANILEGGHGSVLEHACWGFVVCRASRGFTHQMVRHRAGFAFSQESQHFIRYSTEGEKNAPEAAVCVTGIPESLKVGFTERCAWTIDQYAELWAAIRREFPEDAKVKKQVSGAARGLLPNALESRIGFTANARALRHFCELRGTADNVLEVRLVACDVARIMAVEAPAIFQDVTVGDGGDGWPTVESAHRKV